MKRIVCGILLIVMAISLAACDLDSTVGKEINSTLGSSTGTGNSTSTSKDETFNLNETAVFRTLKFTATEVKVSYGETYFEPAAGNVFVGVKFTIENISDKDQTISSLLLFEAYADDVKRSESFTAAVAFGSETLDGTIAPGKKLVGWYPVEVPENWSAIELHVQSSFLSGNSAKFVFTK